MNTNTEKLTYVVPLVIEHHPIQFETLISSNDSTMILVPPKEDLDSPNQDSQHESDQGDSSSSNHNPSSKPHTGHSPEDQPTNSSEAIPVNLNTSLEKKAPSLSLSEHVSGTGSELQDSLFVLSQGQTATEESSSTTPTSAASVQTTSEKIGITSSSMVATKEHTFMLPNTGTMWYNWGLEGLILASLSGLTLLAIKRRKNQSE